MLEDSDIQRLKDIFVTRNDCGVKTNAVEGRIDKDLVKIAVIETKLTQITWILTTVVGGIITMLIKMFFGG